MKRQQVPDLMRKNNIYPIEEVMTFTNVVHRNAVKNVLTLDAKNIIIIQFSNRFDQCYLFCGRLTNFYQK